MNRGTWRIANRGRVDGRDHYLFVQTDATAYRTWLMPVDAFWGKR